MTEEPSPYCTFCGDVVSTFEERQVCQVCGDRVCLKCLDEKGRVRCPYCAHPFGPPPPEPAPIPTGPVADPTPRPAEPAPAPKVNPTPEPLPPPLRTYVHDPTAWTKSGWWSAPKLGPRIAFGLACLNLLALLLTVAARRG